MSIDVEQLKRLDELASAIHGKGTVVEMLNRWAAFEAACKPDLIQAMVSEIGRLTEQNENLLECRGAVNGAVALENEALRKDAERYRWLRDGAGYCDTRDIPGMAPARMDAFIDAAMAKERSQ